MGSYTLKVDAGGETMAGSVTGHPNSWRKAVFKRTVSEEEVKTMEAAVANYVPHVHGPGCGHHH